MGYVPALDGVRAIALFMVLAFHAGAPGWGAGFFGVDLFFVLSGYLITRILIAEHDRSGTIQIARFWLRRLRRLAPAMLAMLAAFLLVAPWAFPQYPMSINIRDAAMSAIYLADYARTLDLPPGVLDHMWSLSVEEHFYLLWPLVLLAVLRLPRSTAAVAVAGLYVAGTLWRWWNVGDLEEPWQVYHRFDTHSTGLFLGCLLGLVKARLPGYYFAFGTFAMLLVLDSFAHQKVSTALYGFTAAEICAAAMVLSQPRWLGWAPLAWIGRMSYGAYLWHYPVVRWMHSQDFGWEARLVGSAIGGIALAALSYYTIEAAYRKSRTPRTGQFDASAEAVRPERVAS